MMESEEPIEHVTNLLKELQASSKQIGSGLVFMLKGGVVKQVRINEQEPVWIQNLKRGIVHLFSVNFLGKDKTTGDNLLFSKTEVCRKEIFTYLCFIIINYFKILQNKSYHFNV